MVKIKYLLPAAVLLLAGALLWIFLFHQTEEQKIRKRLKSFCEEVGKQDREGGLQAMVSAGSLGTYFTDPAVIAIDGLDWLNGSCSPEMITSNALRGRKMFRRLSLVFRNPEIILENERAEVHFTAVLEGLLQTGDAVREVRELDSTMLRTEGKWLFQSVKIQNIIRK